MGVETIHFLENPDSPSYLISMDRQLYGRLMDKRKLPRPMMNKVREYLMEAEVSDISLTKK